MPKRAAFLLILCIFLITQASVAQAAEKPALRVCIGSMILPEAGYIYYTELLNYLGRKLNYKVDLMAKENYEQMNLALAKGDADIAFVCGGPYIDAHDEFGVELLAVPVAYGEPHYYSYIIVNKDSPLNSFAELKGRTFAFTDPLSNSGKIAPAYRITEMGYTPDTFFKKYTYTYHHDKSIHAVALGSVDAAAVDSLIWEYENTTDPLYTGNTRIIEKLGPFGIPPVVVPKEINPGLKAELQHIFTTAHEDPEGSRILKKMHIDKFIVADDSLFDSIRKMKEKLKQTGIK